MKARILDLTISETDDGELWLEWDVRALHPKSEAQVEDDWALFRLIQQLMMKRGFSSGS